MRCLPCFAHRWAELRAWGWKTPKFKRVGLVQTQDYLTFGSAATARHLNLLGVENASGISLDNQLNWTPQTRICGFSETSKIKGGWKAGSLGKQ